MAASGRVVVLTLSIAFVAQPIQKASAQVTFSSYQKSCLNIKVKDGDLLSATCRTRDGKLNNTYIRIPGIENIDGLLTFNNPNNSSSYQKSCLNIKVKDGDLLSATCRTRDGKLNNTYIRIPGIENIDGLLTFNNPNNSSIYHPPHDEPNFYQRLCITHWRRC
ncbi:CVNH domain-containing protein [Nostoc flagelliforme]|uniref:mannose-binding lectin n=1 Tax=Nostoc flagelliforme TaxID=1306274 RepID=UPI0012FE5522